MTQGNLGEFHSFNIPGSFLVHSWDSWDSWEIHQELVGECKELTFHATPTEGLPITFSGGNPPLKEPISVNSFQNQSSSSIMPPILMPAQRSESLS
jgi:hypothetical protein